MIYDSLKNLHRYTGLARNLDTAIRYVQEKLPVLNTLPEGKHPIDGERVIIQVMSYETKDLSAANFEAHRKYIDIQFLLEGKEACYACPLEGLQPEEPFNAEKDIGFFKGEGGAFLPLSEGVFAIFFPWDVHKPSCDWEEKRRVRKVVVKVRT